MAHYSSVPTRAEQIGLFTVLLAIATIAVAFRLFARTRRGMRLAIDDDVIVLAWVWRATTRLPSLGPSTDQRVRSWP